MKPYGSEIEYDINSLPIKLAVSHRLHEKVRLIFAESYGLKPEGEKFVTNNTGRIILTFNKSLEPQDFLRHLHSRTPEQYENLV